MDVLQGANRVRKTEGFTGLLRAGHVFIRTKASEIRAQFGQGEITRYRHESEYGPTLLIDPTNYLEVKTELGYFERELLDRFVSTAKGRSHFADIGANFGLYALVFLCHAPAQATVDAFEPVPVNVERLTSNAAANDFEDRISLHEYALASESSETTIQIDQNALGEATLGDEMWSTTPTRTRTVTVKTLDDVYADGPRPDVVKIDVEGAEGEVIRGGKTVLSEDKPDLFIEKHDELLPGFGDTPRELADLLAEIGYEQIYDARAGRSSTVEEFQRNPDDVGRYLHIQG